MSETPPILVVGAGIAGVTAALEAAEAGREVVVVEREAFVGGRVLRAHQYFPKMCPPSCGMEINLRRLERNPRIRVLTGAEITEAKKDGAGWSVTVQMAPAYVNDRCTLCGVCSEACPTKVPDPFNLGMCEVPAVRLANPNAWPRKFVLDRDACGDGCTACKEACSYDAIDLDAQPSAETLEVGSIVVATGWRPYPVENLSQFGGGTLDDVIANVQMERLAAPAGPTGGKIVRPSTGEPPKKVAFVQCAGSRDVNHLAYCSGVCCLASLKQAQYVKEQIPEAEVTMYYIDRRTPGRNEDVLTKASELEGVNLVKGKVGRIEKSGSGLSLHLEDVESERLVTAEADLVVLATGMVPNGAAGLPAELDSDGFALDNLPEGIVVAGVARRPEDVASSVRDATGAAAKAMVAAGRSA